ncbi:MAG: hypothetical protein MHM6MM_000789 [Cercozoa sp. M6MM]
MASEYLSNAGALYSQSNPRLARHFLWRARSVALQQGKAQEVQNLRLISCDRCAHPVFGDDSAKIRLQTIKSRRRRRHLHLRSAVSHTCRNCGYTTQIGGVDTEFRDRRRARAAESQKDRMQTAQKRRETSQRGKNMNAAHKALKSLKGKKKFNLGGAKKLGGLAGNKRGSTAKNKKTHNKNKGGGNASKKGGSLGALFDILNA